jgi:hypothetical protein
MMRQRLLLFLLGLSPILSLDMLRGLDGVQSGTTIANLILFLAAILWGVVLVWAERIFRPFVPSALRNSPLTSLAMGVTLCLAAALPHGLAANTELSFYQHFRLALVYTVVSLVILYPIVVRILGRLLVKEGLPKRSGLALTILIVGQLSVSAILEYREIRSARAHYALAGLAA